MRWITLFSPSFPRTPMDSLFAAVTWFGSLYVLLPVAALLVMLLLKMGRPGDAALLALSLAATTVAVHLVKLIVRRPRPAATELVVPMPPDWSFPSAHTAQATAVFLTLALIALRRLPPSRAMSAVIGCLLIVAGVGYSRVHLHLHYPSDVIGGLVLAVLMVALIRNLLPHFLPNGRK